MSKQHQSHVKGVTTPDLTLTPIRTGLIQRHLVSSSEAVQNGEHQQNSNVLTTLHREAETQDESSTVASSMVQEALDSRGEPLDQATRSFMEPRFGHDFSKVRVHRDEKSARRREPSAPWHTLWGRTLFLEPGSIHRKAAKGRRFWRMSWPIPYSRAHLYSGCLTG